MILTSTARADVKAHQILLVVNDASPTSQAIGAYYASVRGIPAENQFHLSAATPSLEVISRAEYNAAIRDPIANYLQNTAPALKTQVSASC